VIQYASNHLITMRIPSFSLMKKKQKIKAVAASLKIDSKALSRPKPFATAHFWVAPAALLHQFS
jgi:hypothetical protein